ncbi:hypothetical protein BN1723_007323 [Verticillium longisporum]|uniref:Autophagy-related protein n=1 Tax=Verticillium longisporum TaxID=100787 RepID=A0A0G4NKU3_VERLO|nr:hypothetical protein BN1723_007323 [Verticillium longisporum]
MVPRQDNHARPPPAPRLWSRLSNFSKKSFISFSSSFEADDERSESEDDDDDYHHRQLLFPAMSGRNGDRYGRDDGSPPGRYSGEDTRPTSQKELAGWYAYAFAAETYVICAIGSFIPILLETLARENGVLLSDRTTPCGTSDSKNKADGQCVVYVLGAEVNTASFAMYTFSISVLVQALLVVSISCAADHGNFRKKLLLGFAWTGSVAVMLYIFVSANTYLFGALLAIISNTSFGASFVLLNSFLPLLVRHHPDVIEAENKHVPDFAQTDLESQPMRGASAASDAAPADPDATSPLVSNAEDMVTPDWPRKATREELTSVELNLSTQISAKGIGIGYTAGLFLQCVAIGVLIAMRNTTWSQRVVLFMVGAWWAIFTFPAASWLRPRPGPPLPIVAASGFSGMWAWVGYSVHRTCKCKQPANPDKTLVACSQPNCSTWLHDECLKHDALMRTFAALGTDQPYIAPPPPPAAAENGETDGSKLDQKTGRPLSPPDNGVEVQQSIDAKPGASPEADAAAKERLSTPRGSARGGGQGTSTVGTITAAPGSLRKTKVPKRGKASAARPYEGLFEATLKVAENAVEIRDLRAHVTGGVKVWTEPLVCLVCHTTIS